MAADIKTGSSKTILQNLNTIALSLATTQQQQGKMVALTTENIAIGVIETLQNKPLTIYSPFVANSNLMTIFSSQSSSERVPSDQQVNAIARIPRDLLESVRGKVYSVLFRTDVLFSPSPGNNSKGLIDGGIAQRRELVQSYVMAVSVGNRSVWNLTTPVEITFRIKQDGQDQNGVSRCMFWDPNFNGMFNLIC